MWPLVAKIEPWLKNYDFKVWSSNRQLDNGSMAFYSDEMNPYTKDATIPYIRDKNIDIYTKAEHFIELGLENIAEV